MSTTSPSIEQTCGHPKMDFHEEKISFDASDWTLVGPKTPLHYEGLDTAFPSAVTDSVSNLNSHVCTTGKNPEDTTMRQLSIGTIQNSPTPEIFPWSPYASAAIDVGDHRDSIFTRNSGSRADDTESEVHLAQDVPPEVVPTSFHSPKDDR